jgi:hypothetical protein
LAISLDPLEHHRRLLHQLRALRLPAVVVRLAVVGTPAHWDFGSWIRATAVDPSIGATDVDPVAIAWSAMWLLRLPVADPLLRHSGGGALNALLDLSALAGTALIGGLAFAGSLSGPLPEKKSLPLTSHLALNSSGVIVILSPILSENLLRNFTNTSLRLPPGLIC